MYHFSTSLISGGSTVYELIVWIFFNFQNNFASPEYKWPQENDYK